LSCNFDDFFIKLNFSSPLIINIYLILIF